MNLIVPPTSPTRPRCLHCQGKEQRFVLHDITWQDYQAIGRVLVDRPKLRLTYDRGTLEFMTTSNEHEVYKTWFHGLILTLAEELNLEIAFGGNATYEREEEERGFEPDESYWFTHAAQRRGRITWDPTVDPPPDLIIEIEISRSSRDRMAIFAAFGVPEVWCFDGTTLRLYLLQADRTYQQVECSPTFPMIPVEGLLSFLLAQRTVSYLDNIRAFRTWVREQLARQG